MLRGSLDPATLPQHPPQSERDAEEILHARAIASAPVAIEPLRQTTATDDEYDIISRDEAALPMPARNISSPISMHAYASRPLAAPSSPGAVAAAVIGRLSPQEQVTVSSSPVRPILRTQRTHSRDQAMFPADDDLPDQARGQHSRLNTSATLVDGGGMFAAEGEEESSDHASYSLKPRRESDVMPTLQTLPEPVPPTIVHRDSPAQLSQMASLTGTPGASVVLLGTPPLAGGSEAIVRPSFEQQRRSAELEQAMRREEGQSRVRFEGQQPETEQAESPKSRRKLKDRLFRRP